jgi:osmoprotectant transport system permease protein
MAEIIGWFTDPAHLTGAGSIQQRLLEHILLSGAALLVATLIGLPVGLYIGHTRRYANLAINVANIGRALPSYALVVMILPVSLTISPAYGLDPIPTFVAMTLLAIPPILVGAYAGLRSVDADLVETGRGMGLRERQVLGNLELPLASSIIVGGFRTATLQVIATATIGAILGGGGLGRFIFDGLNQGLAGRASIYAGAILVTVLAVAVDLALALVQRRLTPVALRKARGTPTRGITEPSEVAQAGGVPGPI